MLEGRKTIPAVQNSARTGRRIKYAEDTVQVKGKSLVSHRLRLVRFLKPSPLRRGTTGQVGHPLPPASLVQAWDRS